jgi:hypothetical protein
MNSTSRATQRTDLGIVETFHESAENEAKLFADALATALGVKVTIGRIPGESQHWLHVQLANQRRAAEARTFALGWNARKEYELRSREREQTRARAIALGNDPDEAEAEWNARSRALLGDDAPKGES